MLKYGASELEDKIEPSSPKSKTLNPEAYKPYTLNFPNLGF